MNRLDQLFQQFLRKRTYTSNATASTTEWYESSWKAFRVAHADAPGGLDDFCRLKADPDASADARNERTDAPLNNAVATPILIKEIVHAESRHER